ncbi:MULTISPECIES: heme-binding protein [unclassified Arthrobacter]|uniref:SOUL family heme-binding protein n=1 Tax=unclassified Arthrobacter TaxID=235627 RepID=UPI001E5AFBC2|nr:MULTISPECIES: heme-binding protein [unclassified Arthrobacter]MCC9145450.1 heme-binding protein [Arthrobacter sp. zg-Y919]MDK1276678.1 heme-binding protein [Arthrobacter sp. zg.Y919]WIB04376.1 heme-binding protein [Arthrobacter sp. zg-Y919]
MVQQQQYTVLGRFPGFELRHYPAHLLAQVTVNSGFQGAGNAGFRYLYAYLSGRSSFPASYGQESSGWPASAQRAGPGLAMTAPVLMEPSPIPGAFCVAFVLPADLTASTAPVPEDPAVSIVPVPGQAAAAAAFTGRWSESNVQGHLAALQSAVTAEGFTVLGSPRFARFDPPFRPWFLRRNEVLQDVEGPGD